MERPKKSQKRKSVFDCRGFTRSFTRSFTAARAVSRTALRTSSNQTRTEPTKPVRVSRGKARATWDSPFCVCFLFKMRNIPTKSKGSAASRLCSCSASTQAPPCATPRADGHGCALGGRRSKVGYLFDLSSLCLSLQRPACALVWYLAETFSAMNTHPWPAT